MSESTVEPSELTSQYSAQVAGDLERNLKEQERIGGEIETLQTQLAALRQDHTVLVSIQQALGASATPSAPEAKSASTVPAPRTKRSSAAKPTKDKKTGTEPRKRTSRKSAATAAAASSASPTLVELVREHLAGQGEPRSAAEVTAELGRQHPERNIKTTVVRTTLEGLVAKSQAQRSKQGNSVFYTGPDNGPDTAPAPAEEEAPKQSD
ncbi:regulatory protein [Streptomyces davaonensis JCM 4913]|uniref:Regulatory protein n=1 Tax=Streptomyces davaonensis (strain DSM 101723 / JCM 4913 / KCC S-0913 / 768) TaxID=1214101 RepID=K4QV52_STRDJ|nr:hypothetical protein [Streptomyces davaonensis]CCK24863.1 regulatory protein [Streptomyces davaonensis JCM 4913]